MSVDKWTADILPEWQGANDWQYNITNSCGTNSPVINLSPFDGPEDLGQEIDEQETFASCASPLVPCTSPTHCFHFVLQLWTSESVTLHWPRFSAALGASGPQ